MLEPEAIASAVAEGLGAGTQGLLEGVRCLITAGPTREALDPVRYLSNRSSGKQGFALAEAAQAAGAEVTLISGPTRVAATIPASDASMSSALRTCTTRSQREIAAHQVFIGVAAVADYRRATRCLARKSKKKTPKRTPMVTRDRRV